MKQDFKSAIRSIDQKFAELNRCPMISLKNPNVFPKLGGVYIIYDGKKPLYAGLASNLKQRFKQHLNGSRVQSAFTLKLAFFDAGIKKKGGRYPKRREWYYQDKKFMAVYKGAAAKVAKMKAKYVETDNAALRIILEAYAGLAFKTKMNDFNLEKAL